MPECRIIFKAIHCQSLMVYIDNDANILKISSLLVTVFKTIRCENV